MISTIQICPKGHEAYDHNALIFATEEVREEHLVQEHRPCGTSLDIQVFLVQKKTDD